MSSSNFSFEHVDFVRFAPIAFKQCSKKGLLQELKRGSESSKYFYCLFGNLLYSFEHENDPTSAIGMIFLESCVCKMVSVDNQPVLSVSTVGGRTINLVSCTGSREELQEWNEAIELFKIKNMTRKIDDNETELLQLQHRSQQHEHELLEYEQSLVDLRRQLKELNDKNNELQVRISQLENEKVDVIRQMKGIDSERLLLLKSRGITPKSLPAWALQERPRKGSREPLKFLKLWTGTWNLNGREPFAGMQKDRAKRLLQPFIPDGYDVYVLGVQECPSESVFECLDALLADEGLRRVRLDLNTGKDANKDASGEDSEVGKIFGRSDGALQSLHFTGLVVFAKMNLLGDVKCLCAANMPFSTGKSRGAVGVVLTAFGRTVAFINAQLEAKNNDLRRDQYQSLVTALGSSLAEGGFHLNEQFNHVVWMGDFAFSLVDTSGNPMPSETVVKMLEDGRVLRTLFETHDQLNQDKKNQLVFYGCREPVPFPNFFPTYQKIENRAPVDYSNPDWVKNTYRTCVKESFFRGGSTKDVTPKFADRILYCSMPDLAEDLLPEALPADMLVQPQDSQAAEKNTRTGSPSRRQSQRQNSSGIVVESTTGRTASSGSLSLRVDNYRSVNDGEAMIVSEHSPVFCTFLLRLRHDHGVLPNNVQTGNINSLLSALGNQGKDSPEPHNDETHDTQEHSTLADDGSSSPSNTVDARGKAMARRTWYTSKIGKAKERSSELQRRKSSDDEGDGIATGQGNVRALPAIEKLSLLPHGVYRIRISEIRLIWGVMEESPISMDLLFPAPYEANAGERFTDFESEGCTEDALDFMPDPPSRGNSPVKSPKPGSAKQGTSTCWRKAGNSRTGSSLRLKVDRLAASCVEHRHNQKLPALTLTWKGDEPLDRLHICIKATASAKSLKAPNARNSARLTHGTNPACPSGVMQIMDINQNPVLVDADETITGHCSIALEQLCKVAVSGATAANTTAVRILLNRGRPMFNIDVNSFQRELVSFCCKLELLQ